jgi:hypothetical protein
MAGFKQPVYEILAFNLQSFQSMIPATNFWNKYNSPIANDPLNDYNYKLLDTIAINGEWSYMIYFKNKKKVKPQDWKGTIYRPK